MIDVTAIRDRYAAVSPHLDERGRRSFAAGEARSAGYGGIAAVARTTGIAASTIGRGLKELALGSDLPATRVRRPGGGRKTLIATDASRDRRIRGGSPGPVHRRSVLPSPTAVRQVYHPRWSAARSGPCVTMSLGRR